MSEGAGDDGSGVAAGSVLLRLRRLAAGYGLALAAAFALAGETRRALVLTGGAAVSIVALRSLEGVVRRLSASGPGPPPGLGWRYPLRLLLLVVLVSTLILVGRDPLALVLGVSAVPAAFLAEAALQLLGLRRGRGGAGAPPADRPAASMGSLEAADPQQRQQSESGSKSESESER